MNSIFYDELTMGKIRYEIWIDRVMTISRTCMNFVVGVVVYFRSFSNPGS